MIGSSENRVSYNGNDVTTEFPFAFKILEATDLKLLLVEADGTENPLTSDYFVDMNKSVVFYPGYSPGTEPPASEQPPKLTSEQRLVIYREVPITQESALDEHWPFNVIEAMADKLTIICQQLADSVSRSFRVSSATDKNIDTTIPVSPGKSFRWSDDAKNLEVTEDPARVLPLAESVYLDTVAIKKQTATIKSETESVKAETESVKAETDRIKDLAQEWAEGEGSPDGVEGNRSAKGWAEYIEKSLSNNASLSAVQATTRLVNTAYSVGNVVYTDSNLSVALKCTAFGTTSNTELDVSGRAVGESVEDGSVVWEVVKRDLTDDVEDNLQYLLEKLKKYLPLSGGKVDGYLTLGLSTDLSKHTSLIFENNKNPQQRYSIYAHENGLGVWDILNQHIGYMWVNASNGIKDFAIVDQWGNGYIKFYNGFKVNFGTFTASDWNGTVTLASPFTAYYLGGAATHLVGDMLSAGAGSIATIAFQSITNTNFVYGSSKNSTPTIHYLIWGADVV